MDNRVRVHVITRASSDHPLYQRAPELPIGRIRWRARKNEHHNIERSGSTETAYITTSKVGRLVGILDALGNIPVDGTITTSVSGGTFQLSGELTLYGGSLNRTVDGILYAAGEAALDLARDPQVREVTVSYQVEIEAISGR